MQDSLDIFNQKNYFKIILMLLLLAIAGASIFYTDKIVSKIEEREIQQIKLFAEALKYLFTGDNTADVTNFLELVKETNQNNTIPAIWKTAAGELTGNNVDEPPGLSYKEQQVFLKDKLKEILRDDHQPYKFENGLGGYDIIYYGNSKLLNQLRYYPIVQLIAVLMFGLMTYFAFSYSRRSEQNRVWVGLAKETAHQLGTPLSSLTAWVEFFRADPKYDTEVINELEKDVKRLDVITTRFSNIGSVPIMKEEDLHAIMTDYLGYLQKRVSSKVQFEVKNGLDSNQTVLLNKYLFEWVVENICKNAVDAMEGVGSLLVEISNADDRHVAIDITDTGKGISKNNLKKVFTPGFSTKKRGWGLGLTLAKRIVENYHNGKLLVKRSELGKGTTFRILLPS
jgi:anti-sigma regulatory factor (Ser/Thr protein kinase)